MVPYTWRNTLEVAIILDNNRQIIVLGSIENAGLQRDASNIICTFPIITKRERKKKVVLTWLNVPDS